MNYLIEGFEVGFSLHFEGARESFQAKNLLSCFDNPDVVDKKLAKELAAHGRGTPKDSE